MSLPTTASSQRLKSEFFTAAKLGLGRAYLLAQAHPNVDFSAAIIRAALKNYAYDGQCESSRAHYLFALYQQSKQQARIRRAVLRGLAAEREDTWTLTQLVELAFLFAQKGDAAARAALYHQFSHNPTDADWVGAKEIIALDGLAGIQRVAQHFGRALAKDPTNWQDSYLLQSFQERNPAVDVWEELRQIAVQDADVGRYLQNVEATRAETAARLPSTREPLVLEEAILVPGQRALPFRVRRNLQPSQLQWLAEQLITEKRPAILENLLSVFEYTKFPLAYHPILRLAQRKPNGRYRLAELATGAVAFLHAPEIRNFALQRLARTTRPAQYTSILRSNYQAGDATLLVAVIDRFHQGHIIEQLAVSYIDIYRDNPTPECALPLVALYRKMTCGIHRADVVRLLIENNALPAWLNEELPFDSSDETQSLYQLLS